MATTILFILWGKLKDNNKGVLKDITKSLSHKYELLICLSLYTNGVGYSHSIYAMVVIKKKQ